jgi:hypothetical protein
MKLFNYLHQLFRHTDMQRFAYTLIALLLLFFTACDDKEENTGPTIQFVQEEGFVFSDSSLAIGQTVNVGVEATSGSSNITLFRYTINNDGTTVSIDSGMNTISLRVEKLITKSTSQQEIWTFFVKDINDLSDEVSITFTNSGESLYGPIVYTPNIILGAQNAGIEGFYSLENELSYQITDAHAIQESINLLYYFDFLQGEDNVITSPGANIDASVFNDATYGPENWQVRNTTRFLKKTGEFTVEEFQSSANDSLILNHTFDFSSGKRKCKNLVAGDLYAFVTDENHRGLIHVLEVIGTDTGTVEFEIKMQAIND